MFVVRFMIVVMVCGCLVSFDSVLCFLFVFVVVKDCVFFMCECMIIVSSVYSVLMKNGMCYFYVLSCVGDSMNCCSMISSVSVVSCLVMSVMYWKFE